MSKWDEPRLDERQRQFAIWLLMPAAARRENGLPSNLGEYAAHIGVDRSTLYQWRKKPDFKEFLAAQSTELSLDPARVHEVIEALHRAALQGDVKAMQTYLQHADKLAPKRMVIEDKRIESMSDEEFDAELARVLQEDEK